MERRRDIPALLALIERERTRRFRWGRDCVVLANRAVLAQTGVDPVPELRWRTLRAALAAVAAEGGLIAAYDRRFARIAPAVAQRGDLAGVPAPGPFGVRLAVIEGAMLISPGEVGWLREPRAAMTIAWDAMSVKPVSADA